MAGLERLFCGLPAKADQFNGFLVEIGLEILEIAARLTDIPLKRAAKSVARRFCLSEVSHG